MEPLAYETVEVQKPVGLRALSLGAGLEPDELRGLNPELVRGTTPPRAYLLKVPVGSAADVSRALASIPAAERLEFRSYRIARGDTLAKVAARYKTTPEDLLEYNSMSRSQFRAGRVISVPVVLNLAGRGGQKKAPAKK
jgi:membrane-bound lytic murein transglycosylase D